MVIESPFTGRGARAGAQRAPDPDVRMDHGRDALLHHGPGDESRIEVFILFDGVPHMIWSGSTANRYDNPGPGGSRRRRRRSGPRARGADLPGRRRTRCGWARALPRRLRPAHSARPNGSSAPSRASSRSCSAVLDPKKPHPADVARDRERAAEPLRRPRRRRTALRPLATPYPDLGERARGAGSATRGRTASRCRDRSICRRAGRREIAPLPTLVWIYPHEFTDRDHARAARRARLPLPPGEGPLSPRRGGRGLCGAAQSHRADPLRGKQRSTTTICRSSCRAPRRRSTTSSRSA